MCLFREKIAYRQLVKREENSLTLKIRKNERTLQQLSKKNERSSSRSYDQMIDQLQKENELYYLRLKELEINKSMF